ncbi:MAG: divergent polysaccharide deacetylase family protein [Candidatus Cloacimonetes bacterium]|nr:divergent polysaccharide deacetylase family protein [Candidatus Cloacimonadota bacterium]
MQRKKAKTKKHRTAKKRGLPLWVFVAAGLICFLIIWLITSAPEAGDISEDTSVRQERISEKPVKKAKAEQHKEPKHQPEPEDILKQALHKLGVPLNSVKTKTSSNTVTIKVPLNQSKVDLTFANMIIKGEMERNGAILKNGEDKRDRQILDFSHRGKDIRVNLYYDNNPYKEKKVQKYISIVIDDFGSLKGPLLDSYFDLPQEITFSIFPDMENSIQTMNRAHQQGRETLIHVPMEPIDYPKVNPGKNPVLVQMSEAAIVRLINNNINKMPLCMGINNHMGSLATTDEDVMGYVMKALRDKGKLFLDSRTSNVSVAYQVAQKALVPAYRNDMFLDTPNLSDASLRSKVRQAVSLSEKKKFIIAITHCHSEEKLKHLEQFIKLIRKEGFTLLPLSRVNKMDAPQIL